jgi:16S rRNA (cytosine1402-N4)-methyltransferase
MAQEFTHQPVLEPEITECFTPVPPGVIIDATLGGAGHAQALLSARVDVGLLGVDRDQVALEVARGRLERFGARAVVRHAAFSRISEIIDDAEGSRETWPEIEAVAFPAPVVGLLADLGVSSPQLDLSERGFSFSQNGPLDMRMDASQPMTAASYLEVVPIEDLTTLLRANGEQRYARRIASALKEASPLTTTGELVDVVDRAVPKANRRRGHVASRVFQALRIAVNDEAEELATLLEASIELLAPAGRIVVLSYHSGEDAVVKHQFREWATGGCTCPDQLPCVCGARSRGKVVTKRAIVASAEEIERNPRARSARLRAFEVA